ncbi:MAG: GNAT family N-acetyltransferase [Pricia sp.]|nr:GNAT family N-acetyltransferase [Pricia sp.]
MIQIQIAEDRLHFRQISKLANRIWTEHYTPIIGQEQVTYMLDKFQSVDAIKKQIREGSEYYVLSEEGKALGYFCINRKKESLFLSKLYVKKNYRGKGIGKIALQFIERKAVELGLGKISLTVNKYNSQSIEAYEKMGFVNIRALIQDIGNNFIMDDYLLEKKIINKDYTQKKI